MSGLRAILLSGAIVVGMGGIAHAADLLPPAPRIEAPVVDPDPDFSGWYIRGDVGIGLHRETDMRATPSPLSQGSATFVPQSYSILPAAISGSPFVGLGFGYQFNNWFRMDFTTEYRTSNFSSQDQLVHTNPVVGSSTVLRNFYRGNLTSMVYMLNAYFDLGTWSGVTPFVGVGVGLSRNTLHGMTDIGYSNVFAGPGAGASSSTSGNFKSRTTTKFAWALMAGAAYTVNSRLKMELGYRYLNIGEARSSVPACNAFGPGLQSCSVALEMRRSGIHDLRMGFRWMFASPAPRRVAVQPPIVRKY